MKIYIISITELAAATIIAELAKAASLAELAVVAIPKLAAAMVARLYLSW